MCIALTQDAFKFAEWKAYKLYQLFSQYDKPGVRILDYGCGDGIMSEYIQQFFSHAHVVAVDRCHIISQLPSDSPVQYLSINEFKLSQPEYTFDFVIVSFVLHHMSQGQCNILLDWLVKMLRPQGRMFILDFNPKSIYFRCMPARFFCDHFKQLIDVRKLPALKNRPMTYYYLSPSRAPYGKIWAWVKGLWSIIAERFALLQLIVLVEIT